MRIRFAPDVTRGTKFLFWLAVLCLLASIFNVLPARCDVLTVPDRQVLTVSGRSMLLTSRGRPQLVNKSAGKIVNSGGGL